MSTSAARGVEQGPGQGYQRLLDLDTRPIPALYRECRPVDLGLQPTRASRYTSRSFFETEIAKVWLRTWQYACHEDEVGKPGDTLLYELVGKTVIIVRQHDGSVRAFQNVCLHRGRKLVTSSGCRTQLRCPFHGFTWNIDGGFQGNPFGWDFPQIDPAAFSLPEIRLERWAGFLFVNFDPDAKPLAEFIAPLARHFEHWRIEECYKAAHVGKVVPANWKVCAEAFLESHHVVATHPQVLPFVPCEEAQYDLLSDHVARFMQGVGVTGALCPNAPPDEQARLARMFAVGTRAGASGDGIVLEPGVTARAYAAEAARRSLGEATGRDFSWACDADVIDSVSYDFFPNFHLWGGFSQKICYRFRPHGLDVERTLMEVMLFKLRPVDGTSPAIAPLRMLDADEPWSNATELGYLATIYDQDQANFEPLQEGLRALGEGDVRFARYQELRCRNLHRMIDRYIRD